MAQRGISLLEVLLSLSIIFIVLLAATRFYQVTESSARTNASIRMLNAIATAANDWFVTYKTYQADQQNNIPAITNNGLVAMGDLPQSFAQGNSANPWGGEAIITAKDSTHVTIEFTKIPAADCNNLVGTMSSRMSGSCSSSGSYVATYPPDLLK